MAVNYITFTALCSADKFSNEQQILDALNKVQDSLPFRKIGCLLFYICCPFVLQTNFLMSSKSYSAYLETQKFLVFSPFDDLSLVEDQNEIRVGDGTQPNMMNKLYTVCNRDFQKVW